MNDDQKEVQVDGEALKLTPIEYNILLLLKKNQGRVFSINQIYENIWNEEAIAADNTIAVHIRHIREKIEINPKEPRYLKVVWGLGYKIEKLWLKVFERFAIEYAKWRYQYDKQHIIKKGINHMEKKKWHRNPSIKGLLLLLQYIFLGTVIFSGLFLITSLAHGLRLSDSGKDYLDSTAFANTLYDAAYDVM